MQGLWWVVPMNLLGIYVEAWPSYCWVRCGGGKLVVFGLGSNNQTTIYFRLKNVPKKKRLRWMLGSISVYQLFVHLESFKLFMPITSLINNTKFQSSKIL